ncbi:MAG: hypothetical protein AAFZ80_12155 [Cyanobacteria bacterium P01_A01_bin.105]
MRTEFVALSVNITDTPVALRDAIEAALSHHGEPLRWAIVSVQDDVAQVEAVVICRAQPHQEPK